MAQPETLFLVLMPLLVPAAALGLCRWRTVVVGFAAYVTAAAGMPQLVRIGFVGSFGLLLFGDLLAAVFGRNVAEHVVASLLTDAVRFSLRAALALIRLPGRLAALPLQRRVR